MKTRILTVLFLSLCCICGAFNVEAQPRAPKVSHKSMLMPPPPPVKVVKKIHTPRMFNPIGHIYSFSMPGYNIMYNFSPNGRVYREGDKIGNPYTLRGNMITVYSNRVPQRIIGTGKISRDGRHIEWLETLNGAKYRLRLIG
ncbi:MAG: hypothetical protein J1F38_07060 [Muribaculaceae bacterium]|nr:hypothetical protein [Muribaculaceae bacterium]